MADYALIDSYLDTVSRRLEYRPDRDDLRDELADHLLEATDRAHRRGMDNDAAQRSTLNRFGDPTVVAAMLAAVPTKGIDMIHNLSRAAGTLALLAAAVWLAAIVGGSFGLFNYLDRTWSTDEYLWQSIVQSVAVLVTAVALIGLNLRSAGRVDALTGVVIAACTIAFALSFGFAWAFMAFGSFLAAALAITIARMANAASRSVRALLLVIVPIVLVAASFVGLQLAATPGSPLTSLDQSRLDFGMFIGYSAIAILLTIGLGILGLRLRQSTESFLAPTSLA